MAKGNSLQRARISILRALLVLLGGLLVSASPAAAQSTVPEFEVDAVSARDHAASEETRLDLYTRVSYAKLRFINTAGGFTAQYAVTVEAYELDERNRRERLVQTRLWDQSVVVDNFVATQADQLYDRTTQQIDLSPGRYLLVFQLEDRQTNDAYVRELPVEVRDLNRPVAVSDLILLESYDLDEKTITPSVTKRIGTDQLRLGLFYEVYADAAQRVRVSREVIRTNKSSSTPSVRTFLGLGRDEENTGGEVSYQQDEPTRLRAGRNQAIVEIPLTDLKVGEYTIRVRVEDLQGRLLDQAEVAVTAEWSGLAQHIRDVDEAIAQLQYIAKPKDLRQIRDGGSQTERARRLLDFWKRRDPTPGTDRNERMEEYYYRIDYANREYGSITDGWKTDRGHVMVLFGEPDFVERHPYNFNVKPYEVWYYYRIGRRFIFIDETGFGDFELLVPIWDDRNRLR